MDMLFLPLSGEILQVDLALNGFVVLGISGTFYAMKRLRFCWMPPICSSKTCSFGLFCCVKIARTRFTTDLDNIVLLIHWQVVYFLLSSADIALYHRVCLELKVFNNFYIQSCRTFFRCLRKFGRSIKHRFVGLFRMIDTKEHSCAK